MPQVSWEELSKLKHIVSERRTLIVGMMTRLKRLDEREEEMENYIQHLIITRKEDNA